MQNMVTRYLAAIGAASLVLGGAASARDQIRVVGSSTVFPFSQAVSEQFGAKTDFPAPIVESTGTGGGFALFCEGVGPDTPDVSNASRRIKQSEIDLCLRNGVDEIIEVPVGFDGIVIANAKDAPDYNLTTRHVFQALAARVPVSDDDCTLIDNPYMLWSDIDADLPQVSIEVFGPPPTSGTRDAFVEIAMEAGAKSYLCLDELSAQDGDAFQQVAHRLREDGGWIDAGENDNAIVNTLERTPTALGVAGYSFLDQNSDRIKGSPIDGIEPTFENIASGEYGVSRSIFFYVKRDHMVTIPGLHEYALEFVSEAAAGEFGYLSDKGLIPLPADRRLQVAETVSELQTMEVSQEAN